DRASDHVVPGGRPVRLSELRARLARRPGVSRLAAAPCPPAVPPGSHRRPRPDLRRRRRAPLLPLLPRLPHAARRVDRDLRRLRRAPSQPPPPPPPARPRPPP